MKLILYPQDSQEMECSLHEGIPSEENGWDFEQAAKDSHPVYNDWNYDSIKIYWDRTRPDKFKLSINGEPKKGWIETVSDNESIFHTSDGSQIFSDCYGFVRIELECQYWHDSEYETVCYYSDYLEVMIKPGRESEALDRMFHYIGSKHRRYILADSLKSQPVLDRLSSREKTFSRQLALLRQIQEVYETNLPFFKANPHSVIDSGYNVREFEKLRQVQPETINYIVNHPDMLIPSSNQSGIEYQGNYYLPVKTLVLEAQQSRDCYENAVIMGFFETVIEGINELLKQVDNYMKLLSVISPDYGMYQSSAKVIMGILRNQLLENRNKLNRISSSINNLYWTYRNFLPVTPMRVDRLPKLTSVFLSVAPYRQVYEMMVQWFNFGSYNFKSEEFLLPFMVNYSIYEYYVLFKISDALEQQGFVYHPEESYRFIYPVQGKLYKQTSHTNTFVFRDTRERSIVLYYQPVIFGADYTETGNNGIRLRRVTSLRFDDDKFPGWRENYYTPDYVLKLKNGMEEKYLIADAKFRNFQGSQIAELSYKYAFSIQPASPDSTLAGTVILYGKDYTNASTLREIFDIYSDDRFPKFWITSLTESDDCSAESHYSMLEDLMKKLA